MAKRKSSRGRVLVSRTGRKNTKNINDYINQINKDKSLTAAEKRAKIADLLDYVDSRAKQNRRTPGNRLTTNGFEGWEADTGLERLFANTGLSASEIAARYGFDEDELLDEENWNHGIFTDSNGKRHKFTHSYTGEIFD